MFTRLRQDANDSLFVLRPWCNAIRVRTAWCVSYLVTKAWFTYDRRRSQAIALDHQRSSAIICEQLCDRVRSSAIAITGDRRNRTMFYSCDRLRSSAIECDHMWTKLCDHAIVMCPIVLCFPNVPWKPVIYQLLRVRVFWKDGRWNWHRTVYGRN